MKKIIRRDLAGKQVYPNWRLDKNIGWYNIITFFVGIVYGFTTLEWLRKGGKYHKRFTFLSKGGIWLPPEYAEDYYEYK